MVGGESLAHFPRRVERGLQDCRVASDRLQRRRFILVALFELVPQDLDILLLVGALHSRRGERHALLDLQRQTRPLRNQLAILELHGRWKVPAGGDPLGRRGDGTHAQAIHASSD